MLDPQIAHRMDARTLLHLLPNLDQFDLREIRQEFATFLRSPRSRTYPTWQDAWNAWTGAAPHRPGQIIYTPTRCHECNGRGFTHRNISRNLARTGHPQVCGECRGNRRGQRTRQTATYAHPPQPETEATP